MSETFDIVRSKPLTPNVIANTLGGLILHGRVEVWADVADLPKEPADVCAIAHSTDDPAWPCLLNVLACRPDCGLGTYPAFAWRLGSRTRRGRTQSAEPIRSLAISILSTRTGR